MISAGSDKRWLRYMVIGEVGAFHTQNVIDTARTVNPDLCQWHLDSMGLGDTDAYLRIESCVWQ